MKSLEARDSNKHSFFAKKEQKTFANLVPRALTIREIYIEAKGITKFFWFFLFTKRTAYPFNRL